MSKKKPGIRPIKSEYKGTMLTIAEFILLPECEIGRIAVATRLKAGSTFAQIIKDGNKTERKRVLHKYKNGVISVDAFFKLPLCTIPKNSIHTKLRKGQTMDEIALDISRQKPRRRRGKNKIKKTFAEIKKKKKEIKINLVNIERERIKAIMSVPQSPKTTQSFYMQKVTMAAGVQGATSLNNNYLSKA